MLLSTNEKYWFISIEVRSSLIICCDKDLLFLKCFIKLIIFTFITFYELLHKREIDALWLICGEKITANSKKGKMKTACKCQNS